MRASVNKTLQELKQDLADYDSTKGQMVGTTQAVPNVDYLKGFHEGVMICNK